MNFEQNLLQQILDGIQPPNYWNLHRYLDVASNYNTGGDKRDIYLLLRQFDPQALTMGLAFLARRVAVDNRAFSQFPPTYIYDIARMMIELGADPEQEVEKRIPELHNLDEEGRMGPLGYYIRKLRMNNAAERRDGSNYPDYQAKVRKDILPPWKYRRFEDEEDDDDEMDQ